MKIAEITQAAVQRQRLTNGAVASGFLGLVCLVASPFSLLKAIHHLKTILLFKPVPRCLSNA